MEKFGYRYSVETHEEVMQEFFENDFDNLIDTQQEAFAIARRDISEWKKQPKSRTVIIFSVVLEKNEMKFKDVQTIQLEVKRETRYIL